MADYPRMDPYSRSRYEHGIDAKIVVMGNTGPFFVYLTCFINVTLSTDGALDLGVGKTSLLHRYTQNKFDPRNMTSTTGAFFVTKKVHVDGLKVRLQLWDTAGQERFRSMVRIHSHPSPFTYLTTIIRPPCIIAAPMPRFCCMTSRMLPRLMTYAVG